MIDVQARDGILPEPASSDFIAWVHREFYRDVPNALLEIKAKDRTIRMEPGVWRSAPEHDNVVGRHLPPSSPRVNDFMRHFSDGTH